MKLLLFQVFLCCILWHPVCSQVVLDQPTLYLDTVMVAAPRLVAFSTGSKVTTADTNIMQLHGMSTLADLLSQESEVYIRTIGPGALATPSLRGTGAGHTAVLWNGFNLSGPMSGLVDLSLVPVNFINQIKLQSGGAGALWGSGAIGGTLHLNTVPSFDKGTKIGLGIGYGSFNDRRLDLSGELSHKHSVFITRLFVNKAQNNFLFKNFAQFGSPEQKASNAEMAKFAFMQEVFFIINKYQQLNFRLWYQNNNRNILPSITTGSSVANQLDEFVRATMEWQVRKANYSLQLRGAAFHESLIYANPAIDLLSKNKTRVLILETDFRYNFSRAHQLNFILNTTNSAGLTRNYPTNAYQNRTSLIGSYLLQNSSGNWKGTLTVRKEWITRANNPVTASAGTEKWLGKNVKLRGAVSRNYRVPTFNDLYWMPGGNPNLRPESGWSHDGGFLYRLLINGLMVESQLSVYTSRLKNYIRWLPGSTGPYVPENILAVWSRGIEGDLKATKQLGSVHYQAAVHLQYTLSTIEKTNSQNQNWLKKQLEYTPAEKAQTKLSARIRQWTLTFIYDYVGKRYTTTDNYYFLPHYHLGTLELRKAIQFNKFHITANFKVDNFWNESYQIMAFYPMPGRSFQAGINVSFLPHNKQSLKNSKN